MIGRVRRRVGRLRGGKPAHPFPSYPREEPVGMRTAPVFWAGEHRLGYDCKLLRAIRPHGSSFVKFESAEV